MNASARSRWLSAVGAGAFLLAADGAGAADKPNLSGHWQVVKSRSDDAAAKIEEAAGGQNLAGAGGREVTLIRGTQPAKEVERVELRQRMLELAAEAEKLEINQSAEKVEIVHGQLGVRIFYFGRKHTRETDMGQKLESEARWDGTQLVLDEAGDGMRIAEVYSLLPGGTTMTLALRWEAKRLKKPLELRRFYEKAE